MKDTAARLGGDEFVVLADNLSGPTDAVAIGERILEALSTPIGLAVGPLVPRASIGIAVSSASSVSAEVLLREADSALYQAKRTGRGRAVLSSPQCVLQ
jgi:diguanylate cyclase (GGDEF)-like protein